MDNMEKNYLKYTCIWALIILAGLLLMYFLPAFTVGEHVMRRVDLLGDVPEISTSFTRLPFSPRL